MLELVRERTQALLELARAQLEPGRVPQLAKAVSLDKLVGWGWELCWRQESRNKLGKKCREERRSGRAGRCWGEEG